MILHPLDLITQFFLYQINRLLWGQKPAIKTSSSNYIPPNALSSATYEFPVVSIKIPLRLLRLSHWGGTWYKESALRYCRHCRWCHNILRGLHRSATRIKDVHVRLFKCCKRLRGRFKNNHWLWAKKHKLTSVPLQLELIWLQIICCLPIRPIYGTGIFG